MSGMFNIFAALLLVSGLANCQATGDGANVQIVVPRSVINNEIQALLPEVMKEFDSLPAVTCCYDDVGEKHVHLNMQGIKVKLPQLVIKTSGSGLGINVSGTAEVVGSGSYRLCVHDDPFSKHACSTLFGCKGTFSVEPKVSFAMIIDVHGGNVSVTHPSFTVMSITSSICSKFKDEINKNAGKIAPDAVHAMEALGPKLTASIKKMLKNATMSFEGFTAKVALAAGTTTAGGDLAIRAIVTYTDTKTGAVSPWKLRTPIPVSSTTANNSVDVYVADSVLSNMAYPFVKSGLLHYAKNKSIKGTEYKLYANVTGHGPSVLLNTTHQLLEVPVELVGVSNKSTFHATVVVHVGFSVALKLANHTANGSSVVVLVHLSEDIGVSNISKDCTADCQDLLNGVVVDAKLALPLINAELANKAPAVHLPKAVDVASISVTFGPGYLRLSALPKAESDLEADWSSMFALEKHVPASVGKFACPVIPGAKPDGCI